MLSTRRLVVLGGSALVVFSLACIDFRHTNPFDPAAPITVTITPETLFSVAEGLVQFTLSTVPPFTDSSAIWAVKSNNLSASGNPGLFYSTGAPIWPETETVPIEIGIGRHYLKYDFSHSNSYDDSRALHGSVVITQRLVHVRARCAGPPACDALSAGATTLVFVNGFDALGSGLAGLLDSTANPLSAAPVFVFTVRDPAVASAVPLGMRMATVTAKKTGATWIVAQRDSLRDSVRLVVR